MSAVVRPPAARHPAAGGPGALGRLSACLWPVASGLVAWLVLLARPEGTHPWQALWAEDGTVFLNTALRQGGVGAWFDPYQGYLHLVPRMIASVAALAPPARAPQVFTGATTALAAGCLVLFGWGLRRWLDQAWLRAAFVVGLVMVNGVAQEIDGNAANLHWFLGLGMLGLGLARPVRTWVVVTAAGVGLVFALSEGLGLFAVAVAVVDAALRWRSARDRGVVRVWLVCAAMAVGILAQVTVSWLTPRPVPPRAVPGAADVASWYVQQVVGEGVAPSLTRQVSVPVLGVLLAVVVLGAVGVLLLPRLLSRSRAVPVGSRAWMGSTLVALSVVYFSTSVLVNRSLVERYRDLPAVLLVAGILVLVAGPLRWQRIVFVVVLVALGCAEAGSFATHPRITQSVPWAGALRQAIDTQCHGAATTATVAIAPTSRANPLTARWSVTVPCPS